MAKSKSTYQKAYNELQEIVAKMQNEEISLDDLAKEVKRATELIHMCKEKLRSIEVDLEKNLEE